MLNGLAEFIIGGLIAMVILAGVIVYTVVDYFFLSDSIESKTLIIPEKKLVIGDNKVDTIYAQLVQKWNKFKLKKIKNG